MPAGRAGLGRGPAAAGCMEKKCGWIQEPECWEEEAFSNNTRSSVAEEEMGLPPTIRGNSQHRRGTIGLGRGPPGLGPADAAFCRTNLSYVCDCFGRWTHRARRHELQ